MPTKKQEPKELILVKQDTNKPVKPCWICNNNNWWQRKDGGWCCLSCHPKIK